MKTRGLCLDYRQRQRRCADLKARWLAALLVALAVGAVGHAAPALSVLQQGRIAPLPEGVRVLFPLSQPAPVSAFTLNDPPRLVIDLARTRSSGDLEALRSPHWRSLRVGIHNGYDLRLVFDLHRPSPVDVEVVQTASGPQLKVELRSSPPQGPRELALLSMAPPPPQPVLEPVPVLSTVPSRAARAPAPALSSALPPSRRPAVSHRFAPLPVPRPKPLRRRDFLVAIDPGHGGNDPGAIGPKGTYEKDITLAISRRLARLINAQPGLRAMLTRDDDRYLKLHERIQIARRHQADLFVSIHADAFHRPEARGSSVYMLSTRGASSTAARYLAARENEADLIGGGDLNGVDSELAPVVFSIYHDAILADSLRLGERVLAQLEGVGRLHKVRVERAGFAVLKAPDIPSILVETAFISNPHEERKLRDGNYQESVAAAIMNGILAYHNTLPLDRRRPPLGSIAARE